MGPGWADGKEWIPFGEILPEGCDSNPSDFYPTEPWPYLVNGSPNPEYEKKFRTVEITFGAIDKFWGTVKT